MPKLTRLYTRQGDEGTTALGGGQRVPKDDLRVAAYGTVDELNAHLGLALALGLSDRPAAIVARVQNELFHLGTDLCFLETDKANQPLPHLGAKHVGDLETLIDELTTAVGPLQNFILPGGAPGAAQLQVARTVCRRAERVVTTLARETAIAEHSLPYLNRLSDALFALARFENHTRGVVEPLWDSRA